METEVPEMVIIIEDDAILRAQPSTETETVGMVNAGTGLELLGTVEAEESTYTTDAQEIQNAEFVTESFSYYTVTWQRWGNQTFLMFFQKC